MLIHFEEHHPVNKADSGDRPIESPILNGKSASGDDFRSQVAYHTVGHRTISYQTLSGFCVEAADV